MAHGAHCLTVMHGTPILPYFAALQAICGQPLVQPYTASIYIMKVPGIGAHELSQVLAYYRESLRSRPLKVLKDLLHANFKHDEDFLQALYDDVEATEAPKDKADLILAALWNRLEEASERPMNFFDGSLIAFPEFFVGVTNIESELDHCIVRLYSRAPQRIITNLNSRCMFETCLFTGRRAWLGIAAAKSADDIDWRPVCIKSLEPEAGNRELRMAVRLNQFVGTNDASFFPMFFPGVSNRVEYINNPGSQQGTPMVSLALHCCPVELPLTCTVVRGRC